MKHLQLEKSQLREMILWSSLAFMRTYALTARQEKYKVSYLLRVLKALR